VNLPNVGADYSERLNSSTQKHKMNENNDIDDAIKQIGSKSPKQILIILLNLQEKIQSFTAAGNVMWKNSPGWQKKLKSDWNQRFILINHHQRHPLCLLLLWEGMSVWKSTQNNHKPPFINHLNHLFSMKLHWALHLFSTAQNSTWFFPEFFL